MATIRKLDGALPLWNWTRLMNETENVFNGMANEGESNILGTLSNRKFVPIHPACFGVTLTFSSRKQFEKILCEELPSGFSYMLSKSANRPREPWIVAMELLDDCED